MAPPDEVMRSGADHHPGDDTLDTPAAAKRPTHPQDKPARRQVGRCAVECAAHHWKVGPLCKHDPDDPRRIRILSPYGKDPVGHLVPHGVLDFTDDVATVAQWWSRTPWNIGVRVPESMFVLDVESVEGHGVDGLGELARLEDLHGPLPDCLTTLTGAGGKHLFFRRPPGKLTQVRLPKGIEFKTSSGYVVMAPSIHPATWRAYTRVDGPVPAPPRWLIDLVTARPVRPSGTAGPRSSPFWHTGGPSPAEAFNAATSWTEILGPHGWECVDADPDSDGARWLHPAHTSSCSATVRHGCLFVWSTSTLFEASEPGNPKGYTKFRAWALLDHGGDMKVAARALKGGAR